MASPATALIALLIAIATASTAFAQFEMSRHTIDAGGGVSAGPGFELAGTIGQHDAGPATGPMTGGAFTLTGGFWAAESPQPACTCPGDMNADGLHDGDDIQLFVNCLIGSETGCACADLDGTDGISASDLDAFVSHLIAADACP
jgi:hypothetical protein